MSNLDQSGNNQFTVNILMFARERRHLFEKKEHDVLAGGGGEGFRVRRGKVINKGKRFN